MGRKKGLTTFWKSEKKKECYSRVPQLSDTPNSATPLRITGPSSVTLVAFERLCLFVCSVF